MEREREVSQREEDLAERTKPIYLEDYEDTDKYELQIIDNVADELGDKLVMRSDSISSMSCNMSVELDLHHLERESLFREKEIELEKKLDFILSKEEALHIKEMTITMKEEQLEKLKIELMEKKKTLEEQGHKECNADRKATDAKKILLLSTLNDFNVEIEEKYAF